ncbi:phosphohistidine phosphatase SixA [Aestuariicella hydrocarbonica]|uniref:Phosphohistidine phosphatase SixA n=1 Tax=Pseudomaricurvus hydrocarbonicus TaxID=1470433 RepID=A0A9E5JQ31_9GAMM|nr:phosphohistidine phosphatase SixA [Aestuariicella hydrocarbonica]NHO64409.1 phosphohistidine phosphatase SixA [Aestuariicella hydrocarbonica]
MQVFILRHGEAQLFADSDPERALTSIGYQQTVNILTAAKDELSQVTRIIASPYVRAQQTATLASDLLSLPVTTSDLLVPEGNLSKVTELLDSLSDEVPLLVSHQPLVGTCVNWLCGLKPGQHFMGTSALASVKTDVMAASCGELIWLKQPGVPTP